MTRTIFLVTGIVLTAFAVAVPSALASEPVRDHGDATQAKLQLQSVDAVKYFYENERATVGFGPVIHDHGDAAQAKLVAQSVDAVKYFYENERATIGFGPVIHDHGDATQAKLVAQSPPMEVIRDHGDATQAKLVAQSSGTPSGREVESTSTSEVNWSQLAIGLGVGIFLVAGLILAVQFTRNQRLAH